MEKRYSPSQINFKEMGEGRQNTGERKRKKGDGRKEMGERRREKGDGRKEIIFEKFSAYNLAGKSNNF